MNLNPLLDAIEHQVLSRSLTPIERFVFTQSWDGRTYNDIARVSGYDSVYVKQIGSQLWQDLSDGVGTKVTKKNLHIVFGSLDSDSPPSFSTVTTSLNLDRSIVPVEMPSGPLPADSPLYVERPPIETLVYEEIEKPGCAICIQAPQKTGKNSLLNQLFARVEPLDYHTVSIDFQEADASVLASLDRLLRWFCANVSHQLSFPNRLKDYWDEDMGSKVSCKLYFEGYLLSQLDKPVVLAFNEVHRLFGNLEIASDFLLMLRVWHEQARFAPLWQNLRLVLLYRTESYVRLRFDRSPLPIGLSVQLPPFDREQVRELARRYGLLGEDPDAGTPEIDRIMLIVGGHPYLVNLTLYHLSQGNISFESLVRTAPTQTGIFRNYLRDRLATLHNDPILLAALQQVVSTDDGVELEAITAYKLESLGVICLDGNRAYPSCQLDRLYFREQLANFNTDGSTGSRS
ncbi:AAA-like domain-containing protein [Baaleninema sp.]|uniref:AAA-like domain-containing protein n=1 Tax=Baaleninema sp. TaxID=3101197 RepID=UPI003D01BF51